MTDEVDEEIDKVVKGIVSENEIATESGFKNAKSFLSTRPEALPKVLDAYAQILDKGEYTYSGFLHLYKENLPWILEKFPESHEEIFTLYKKAMQSIRNTGLQDKAYTVIVKLAEIFPDKADEILQIMNMEKPSDDYYKSKFYHSLSELARKFPEKNSDILQMIQPHLQTETNSDNLLMIAENFEGSAQIVLPQLKKNANSNTNECGQILNLVARTDPKLKEKLSVLFSQADKTEEELQDATSYVRNTLKDFTDYDTAVKKVSRALYPKYIDEEDDEDEWREDDLDTDNYVKLVTGLTHDNNLPKDWLLEIYADVKQKAAEDIKFWKEFNEKRDLTNKPGAFISDFSMEGASYNKRGLPLYANFFKQENLPEDLKAEILSAPENLKQYIGLIEAITKDNNLPADLLQEIYDNFTKRKISDSPSSAERRDKHYQHLLYRDIYDNFSRQENLPKDLESELHYQSALDYIDQTEFVRNWSEQWETVDEAFNMMDKDTRTPEQIQEFLEYIAESKIHDKTDYFVYFSKEQMKKHPESASDTADAILSALENTGLNGEGFWNEKRPVELLCEILDEFPEKKDKVVKAVEATGLDDVYGHKLFSKPKMLEMLEEANAAIKNNDKKALTKFKARLAKMSEKEIFQIDHAAMEYLVNNFTPENLEKVNNLRSFWGLKAVVSEETLTEKNLRDIERMEFDHSVSITEKANPHYEHTYSEAYKNFVPDYNKEYKAEEYAEVLEKSEAVKMLNEHGFDSFTKQLPKVLSHGHVPPELVPELCVKDLQHLLVDSHGGYSRNGMYDFENVGIAYKPDPVRETFWKNVVKDKKLVEFISNDLKEKGVDEDDIALLWKNAKEYGYPNAKDDDGNHVNSVFFQVHHRVALKDGGKNEPDNFVIVVNIPGEVNSHNPLHEYDNPLVHLYKLEKPLEDGTIISKTPQGPNDKEIRLNTVFVQDEQNMKNNSKERVLYYGGPRSSSMYVGKVHQAVRTAINKISKVLEELKEKLKKEKNDTEVTPKHKKATPKNINNDIIVKSRRKQRKTY